MAIQVNNVYIFEPASTGMCVVFPTLIEILRLIFLDLIEAVLSNKLSIPTILTTHDPYLSNFTDKLAE
jgi:hypothetical protein